MKAITSFTHYSDNFLRNHIYSISYDLTINSLKQNISDKQDRNEKIVTLFVDNYHRISNLLNVKLNINLKVKFSFLNDVKKLTNSANDKLKLNKVCNNVVKRYKKYYKSDGDIKSIMNKTGFNKEKYLNVSISLDENNNCHVSDDNRDKNILSKKGERFIKEYEFSNPEWKCTEY